MTPRVTARTFRTEVGTTHTVYEVGDREFYDADALQAHLDDEAADVHASSTRAEATA